MRVTINLDDPRAHPAYVFYSAKKGQVLTVWEKRIGVKKGKMTTDALWDTRLDGVRGVEEAYAALKAEAHWFKPVRVELRPHWKGPAQYVFLDAKGRERRVSAAAAPVETPQAPAPPPAEPEKPAPPPAEDPAPNLPPPAERGPPEAPPPPPGEPTAKVPKTAGPHIHEDLLGFRRVRGVSHGDAIRTLSIRAGAREVMDRIAEQFGIPREKVEAMGLRFGLRENSEPEAWLAVYDRLQAANRAEFEQLDAKKYHGWGSFRKLANRTYPAGWKGTLLRTLEVHKHLVGLFVRLPLHLFDQFIFGYFRKALSYEYFRGKEDFFSIREALDIEKAREKGTFTSDMLSRPRLAERALEQVMQAQYMGGLTERQRFEGRPWVRALQRHVVRPWVQPLWKFTWRRASLAVFSAVAMGLVSGLVPLPLLGFHLTAIPVLGSGLAWLSTGLPAAVAGVPVVGEGTAAVLSHAAEVFLGEMTVGGILNALTLSTALTFPNAVKMRLMEDRGEGRLSTPRLRERAFWHGVVGTFFSLRFWGQNLKSFLGLITVGAEIEAVMGYAGGLDAAVTPAFKAVTGHEFKLFHTVAAAVERPEGDSPIPFGGAITWGNVLIYKLQNLVGLNLTDEVYALTRGLAYGDLNEGVGQQVVSARAGAVAPVGVPAPGLEEGPAGAGGAPGGVSVVAAAVAAVSRAGAGAETKGRTPGDIRQEIERTRQAIAELEGRAASRQTRLGELEGESKPVSEADERAYQETLRLLSQKSDQAYVQSKLAEIHDLKNPQDGAAAFKALEELAAYYQTLLPAEGASTGYAESLGVRMALIKTVQQAWSDYQAGPTASPAPPARAQGPLDREATARIEPLVAEIERLRGEAKGELANRDALERLLTTVSKARNLALGERRSGREMLEFHKNMARLATVMDLAFSLNTIEASQKAILDMQAMLDAKLEKIRRTAEQAERDRAEAERQRARNEEWRREIDAKVAESRASQSDMQDLERQTREAVENISAFRTDLRALLARLDAEDAGASPNAKAEYDRRKALLPVIQSWNRDGKPGDPDFTSVKSLREHLVEIDDYLTKVGDGLSKIDGAPVEFAGVLVVAVPGVPEVNVNNPSAAQTLQILAARRAHWEAELAKYRETRDEFRNRMDASFTGTETDDFGDVHPFSLPRRLAQAQSDAARHSAAARDMAARIDAAAADLRRAVPGADLPNLTGLGLEAYRTAIEQYPDKLTAVVIPTGNSAELQDARMALLKVGRLISPAARAVIEWSEADATVTGVQDALASPVPQAAALYGQVVSAIEGIIADVDADVAYVNAGFPQGQNQGLIDRKRALLRGLQPMLQQARDTIANHALPFQESAVRSYDPNGDKYARLINAQVRLYDGTKEAVDETLPWALASNGARKGDTAGALANIESQRQRFRDLIVGYDDAEGHHKGIDEHLAEIARRKDPNFAGTEEVYGQVLPISLPRLISQFGAEKEQRAGEMNRQNADLNAVLDRLETMTGGRFGLAARKLPTGLGTDAGSVARVQALVDARAFQNLGDLLTAIGNEYKEKSGSVGLGETSGGTVPSGQQPPTTVDDNTQIALLALEAAKRLVPSSTTDLQAAPAAYAVARFLYSDAAVEAARENLYDRIPVAEVFLNQAKTGLNEAIADLDRDVAYVQANGGGEAADSVIDRKVRVYSSLNAVTRAGVDFYGLKVTWDQGSYDTLGRMDDYYGSTTDIYANSGTVTANEIEAINKMKDALKKTFDDLEVQRRRLTTWMAQLNSPEESALKRVATDLRDIQEKTRAVLEANVQFHEAEARFKRSEEVLAWTLNRVDKAQTALARELKDLRDPSSLDPSLRRRIEALRFEGSSWAMDGDTADATAALVVPKRDFARFVDTVFSALLTRVSSTRDLSGLKRQLLENPSSLSDVLPNAQIAEFGDADGFYMVYQSQFSVPNGLETSNWVTLGNVAKLWGNNISVTGYQFASPPNDLNAPWGDKGVSVQVESLQGKNWVNYLNVDFHRFIQDIPPDTRMASTARQSRIMVFEDFAVLLFGDKLYVAFTGFADVSTTETKEKPQFYGGSFKTSLKFTEVMRLNAEQQQIFAKDPRFFLQTVNLDFTGLDPDLNRDFVIESRGENKHYKRTQIGPQIDVARLMDSQDAFTVDMFWAKQEGTDDYDQQSLGVSVLKGFSIRASDGKPWMVITNRAGAEFGDKQNIYSDRVNVALPNWGVAVSAEGRLIGDAKTYYLQAGKKMGDNSEISVGYGTRYPGMPERLTIQMNTSFTLGQLWRSVAQKTAEELQGGDALKGFDASLDAFYAAREDDARVKDLRAAFQRDVASRLVRQDIGRLAKDIRDLRAAGAFMDNTRVRGMVGFVSNPIGDGVADRAVGGGFTAGTQTTLTLNETQKALLDQKVHTLYREGLRLQARMMDLTKEWQAVLVEVAEAQWELKMAKAMAERAPDEALRREGAAREAAAELRLRQAAIRYNTMVGRPEGEALPFTELSAADLKAVLGEIEKIMAASDPLTEMMKGLDPEVMKDALGDQPFNIVDWIPWVEQITFSFGAQFQDYLANQVLGIGGSVRLPIYDPASKERDKAYRFEATAQKAEMLAVWEEYSSRAEAERLEARGWRDAARMYDRRAAEAQTALADAVRGYRNGLVTQTRLREAYDQWRFYTGGVMTAASRATLAQGWAGLDQAFGRARPDQRAPARVDTFQQAFDQAASAARGLDELEARRQAAEHMTLANASRIQKFYADLFVGWNITATGVGWLPSFGMTGVGITPILTFELKTDELRDLQVRQGQGQEAYHRHAQTKLEADLALEFYRQTVAWSQAGRLSATLQGDLIPALEAALAAADGLADPAARQQARAKAQKDLDAATRRLQLAVQQREQARAALNHLLGRAPDAPLELGLTPERALADLRVILAQKAPVAADRAVLDSRVEVARAVETMADKNLKIDELRLEPVSLVVRSLGRLARALSDEGIGNPDLVAAARVQTLEAERARAAYDEDLPVRQAQVRAELTAAESALREARGRGDAQGRLEALELEGRILLLQAALARLGADAAPARAGALPGSFAELADRVAGAEQDLAYTGRDPRVEVFQPETQVSRSVMGVRYFDAKQDLGRNPIDRKFVEGWVEFRMRSQATPEDVLMALAKLRTDKATRIHANEAAAARARGQVLTSDFETTVRLKRWLDAQAAAPVSKDARGDLAAFQTAVETRLAVQAGRIKALLGLPADTPTDALTRLVPGDADGRTGDVTTLARRMLADVAALDVARLRETVFEGGIPESFGNEDSLIHQIRADVIADRMSYKGFTPVAAFGVFRARPVHGVYLEAPDPRSIEAGLQRVLSDSVRRELESQGRMRELALNLHLLMTGVEGRAKLAERQAAQVQAAQAGLAAAAARVDRGLAGQEELFSAQDALVRSWLDLSNTLTSLKRDFITLVTELEALGYDHKKLLGLPAAVALPRDAGVPGAPAPVNPSALLAEYASRRSLDPAFSERLRAALAALPGAGPEAAAAYAEAADWHRRMSESAELVRRHPDYSAEERLALLTKADAEGRRQQVEGILLKVFEGLRAAGSPGAEVTALLGADINSELSAAAGLDGRERALEGRLRQAALDAVRMPHAVRGAVDRLEDLRSEMAAARQSLREEALRKNIAPTEFILTDQALDRFLRLQSAYDEAVARLYASPELKADADLARFLDGVHPLRESLARRMDLVRQGRGMLALDALVSLAGDRVAALRWERGLPSELDRALAAERQLVELRAAWRAKDPKGLEPLVVLTRPGADGARSWEAKDWMTESDLRRVYGDRVQTDAGGRRWVTLRDGVRYEVVGGLDAAEARLNAARGASDANAARRKLYDTLRTSEFALLALDGGAVEGLSYAQLTAKARAGQTFVFAAEADARGLRPAAHPLKALWDGPGSVETIVYTGDRPLGRDRFPTYESLREHLEALRRSGPEGEAEAAKYLRLEAGPEGLAKMLEAAKTLRERSERAGWVGVKLQSYGAAVDEAGAPRRLYLTKDDFDAALKDLNDAPRILAEARGTLASAAAARDAARAERDAAKPATDRESAAFQAADRDARERLKAKVEADTPRREGEGAATHALRLKAALDEAVAKDREVKRAQDRLGEAVEAFNKLDQKARDAERAFDRALDALRAAAELNAHAGHWAAVKDAVLPEILKAMEQSGLSRGDIAAEEGRLDGAGRRSLVVSRDVLMHIDSQNNLVRVTGTPVFGARALDKAVGTPDGAVRTVGGELFAAVMDVDGRLVKLYMDRASVAQAGRGWTLVGVDGKEAGAVADKSVNPNFRLLHYADPATALRAADGSVRPGTALPVMLNRRYMIEMLSGSAQAAVDAKSWAYGPWNWGNILWEIPKGVLGTPIELATGRDANQNGYLGRVGMYKIEGGATEHHGFFRRVLGVLDILDLMPERVDWYFDPSQFPERARLDSELLPGQNIHDKDLRAGDKDVHFGRRSLERTTRWQAEDLVNAERRVLGHFHGGVQETWLEDRRGREPGRTYTTSRLTGRVGADAVDRALLDEAVGSDDRSLRPGEGPVSLTGRPGHIEVDRVERRVEVNPGAGNYSRVADRLSGLPEVVAGRARGAEERAPTLAEDLRRTQAETDARRGELDAVRGEEAALLRQAHEQGWRIGAQRALEREMARLAQELRDIRAELARQRQRLAELEDELRRVPTDPRNPDNPSDPSDPTNPAPLPTLPAWAWALLFAAAAAAVALLIELLRRRRPIGAGH